MAYLVSMVNDLFEINEGWTSIQDSGGGVYGSVRMRPSPMGDFSTSWARSGEVFELSSMLCMSPKFETHARKLMPGDYMDLLPDLLGSVYVPLDIQGVQWSLVAESERLALNLSYDWFMDEGLFGVTDDATLLTSLLQIAEGLEWFLERMTSMLYLVEAPQNLLADRTEHLACMLERVTQTAQVFFEQSGEA